eukprot:1281214-Pleurochrysis_carterae.AAC.1
MATEMNSAACGTARMHGTVPYSPQLSCAVGIDGRIEVVPPHLQKPRVRPRSPLPDVQQSWKRRVNRD